MKANEGKWRKLKAGGEANEWKWRHMDEYEGK